jgi:hypothetical protein
MSDNDRPLLSTSDDLPSTAVLLERLRADGKQPTIKVPGCVGCGKIHRGLNEGERCIREALIEARAASVLTVSERAELVELREKVERLEREIVDRGLWMRGRERVG